MLPASNQGVGENVGFPDTCNTPIGTGTSPITYPNQGSNSAGLPCLPTVFLSLMPGHNQNAKPLLTNGDNAGVAHSSFMQSGGNTLGSLRVLLSGGPAETLTNTAQGNNYNCSSNAKLVPSLVNILFGDASPMLPPDPRPDVTGALCSGRVGWLTVSRCSLQAVTETARLISGLKLRGAQALVLDLRGNPGGFLQSAAALAALFLPAGSVALEAQLDAGRARWESAGPSTALPLVVLVDGGTASAAEALAATLQDQGRAVVVGEASHGKALIARTPGGSRLGTLQRPGGVRLGRVQPERPSTPGAAVDAALTRALQLGSEYL